MACLPQEGKTDKTLSASIQQLTELKGHALLTKCHIDLTEEVNGLLNLVVGLGNCVSPTDAAIKRYNAQFKAYLTRCEHFCTTTMRAQGKAKPKFFSVARSAKTVTGHCSSSAGISSCVLRIYEVYVIPFRTPKCICFFRDVLFGVCVCPSSVLVFQVWLTCRRLYGV